jgi:molybdenum cofactor biosynthesis protein B
MGHHSHRAKAEHSVSIAVLSVSTSRTLETDDSGHWIAESAAKEKHRVVAHRMVTDDADAIRAEVTGLISDPAPDVLIVTGGTGISPRDVTIEAIKPMFTKEMTAFGPIFAQLSYKEIDSAALLSRATAGVIGKAMVFCLPGSLKACQLGCRSLILPELGHVHMHAVEA